MFSLFVPRRYKFSASPTAGYQRIRRSTSPDGDPEVPSFSLDPEGMEKTDGGVCADAKHFR